MEQKMEQKMFHITFAFVKFTQFLRGRLLLLLLLLLDFFSVCLYGSFNIANLGAVRSFIFWDKPNECKTQTSSTAAAAANKTNKREIVKRPNDLKIILK